MHCICLHYMCAVLVQRYFFFLDEFRKFTISDFPKQMHLGYTLTPYFFPTSYNQSTLHQNVFVLTALAQAIG